MKNNQKKRRDASEREMRECSRDPLRTFLLHTSISRKCPCKVIADTFCSFSIIDKSINNLPLFLLDVNVYVLQLPEASFQCTRRNQKLKMTRDGDPTNYRLHCVLNFLGVLVSECKAESISLAP